MFARLPSSFPKLQAHLETMGTVTVGAPPKIFNIGQRLREAYAQTRPDGYLGLSPSDVRKLPYAYWLAPEAPLPLTDQLLVQRYWSEALPEAINSGSRRAKRWLSPLFFTYCEAFDPADGSFLEFSKGLITAVSQGQGAYAEKLGSMHRRVAFFEPEVVAQRLATVVFMIRGRLDDVLEQFLLWDGFADTRLGAAVLDAALGFSMDKLSDWSVISRLLEWADLLAAPIVKTAHRVGFANALLCPWHQRQPDPVVKAGLIKFFVATYGDPRLEVHRQFQWRGVDPRALSVLMTWLAGDTLRGFIKVLESTADDTWRYRQNFWMAYYNAGCVEEAWLALGAGARTYVGRLQADDLGMGYGKLDGGAAPNQSVLLLKIGDLVFTEWSHNGSLRAYTDGSPGSPVLYRRAYHGSELRSGQSMDFHDGANTNPELRHINSSGGTWQRKARDFIRSHTGINLSDRVSGVNYLELSATTILSGAVGG